MKELLAKITDAGDKSGLYRVELEEWETLDSMLKVYKIGKNGQPLKNYDFFPFKSYHNNTVSTTYDPNNVIYLSNLEKQMNIDITKISAYLEKRINDLGLLNHSFYVYILPLNNAVFDKSTIMEDALEVGK